MNTATGSTYFALEIEGLRKLLAEKDAEIARLKEIVAQPKILSQNELETLLGLPILRLIAKEDAERGSEEKPKS